MREFKMKELNICRVCGEEKLHTVRGNGKLQTMCVDCKSEYNQQYYEETKEKHNPSRKKRREKEVKKIQILIRSAKDVPCMDCGVRYPYYVMQFDHVRGDKKFNLASGTTKTIKVIQEEIDKCEVVCANCHAERTHAPLA